jgi:hypothetical protein
MQETSPPNLHPRCSPGCALCLRSVIAARDVAAPVYPLHNVVSVQIRPEKIQSSGDSIGGKAYSRLPKNAEPYWYARLAADSNPQSSQLQRQRGGGTHGDSGSATALLACRVMRSGLNPLTRHAIELEINGDRDGNDESHQPHYLQRSGTDGVFLISIWFPANRETRR